MVRDKRALKSDAHRSLSSAFGINMTIERFCEVEQIGFERSYGVVHNINYFYQNGTGLLQLLSIAHNIHIERSHMTFELID